MTSHFNHPYHLVDKRPWPILSAFGVLSLVRGVAKWFHTFNCDLFLLSLVTTILIMCQ